MSVNTAGPGVRDGYLDLLRVACVLTVVWTHWATVRVWVADGRVGAVSFLDELPSLAVADWVFMVSPLLLFVGGAANHLCFAASRRHGGGFLRRRARRLLPPLLAFVAAWTVVEVGLHAFDVGGDGVLRWVGLRGVLPFGPLWFIAVYFVLVAMTPLTVRLHERFGLAVPMAFAGGTAVVDVARFVFDVPLVGWFNVLLAWAVPHQLGHAYAAAPARTTSRALAGGVALCGLAGLMLLTMVGGYPLGIGGRPGDPFSNMNPPTLCVAAAGAWQAGLALCCARVGARISASPRVAAVVARLGPVVMTIYLWHMSAVLVTVLLVRGLGFAGEAHAAANSWAHPALWLALDVVCLVLLVRLFGRVERIGRRSQARRTDRTVSG